MIEIKGNEKVYHVNTEIGKQIFDYLYNNQFWNVNRCTQEVVGKLTTLLASFTDDIKEEIVPVTIRRHETEDEARAYFGADFIREFDTLIKQTDDEESVMAIHGTTLENAAKIADEGLYYKNPGVLSTACIQERSLDGYKSYETLLNWPHREYKGLVLLAIPYECFYKEPLWEKMDVDDNSLWKYKIKPEYIVGYIDVSGKKIVKNHNYSRNHDYQNLEYDLDIYHKRDITNKEFYDDSVLQDEEISLSEFQTSFAQEESMGTFGTYHENEPIRNVDYITSGLMGIINSCLLSGTGIISEYQYRSVLDDIKIAIKYLGKELPKLKTNEEAKKAILLEEEKRNNIPKATDEELKEWGFSWDEEETKKTK